MRQLIIDAIRFRVRIPGWYFVIWILMWAWICHSWFEIGISRGRIEGRIEVINNMHLDEEPIYNQINFTQ